MTQAKAKTTFAKDAKSAKAAKKKLSLLRLHSRPLAFLARFFGALGECWFFSKSASPVAVGRWKFRCNRPVGQGANNIPDRLAKGAPGGDVAFRRIVVRCRAFGLRGCRRLTGRLSARRGLRITVPIGALFDPGAGGLGFPHVRPPLILGLGLIAPVAWVAARYAGPANRTRPHTTYPHHVHHPFPSLRISGFDRAIKR